MANYITEAESYYYSDDNKARQEEIIAEQKLFIKRVQKQYLLLEKSFIKEMSKESINLKKIAKILDATAELLDQCSNNLKQIVEIMQEISTIIHLQRSALFTFSLEANNFVAQTIPICPEIYYHRNDLLLTKTDDECKKLDKAFRRSRNKAEYRAYQEDLRLAKDNQERKQLATVFHNKIDADILLKYLDLQIKRLPKSNKKQTFTTIYEHLKQEKINNPATIDISAKINSVAATATVPRHTNWVSNIYHYFFSAQPKSLVALEEIAYLDTATQRWKVRK